MPPLLTIPKHLVQLAYFGLASLVPGLRASLANAVAFEEYLAKARAIGVERNDALEALFEVARLRMLVEGSAPRLVAAEILPGDAIAAFSPSLLDAAWQKLISDFLNFTN